MSEKQLTPEEHNKIMVEIAALINSAYPPYNGVPMSEQDAGELDKLNMDEFDPGSGEGVALELDNEGEATDKVSVEIGMDGDQIISCEDLDAMANGSSDGDGGMADAGPVGTEQVQYPGSNIITDEKLQADANQNEADVTDTDLHGDVTSLLVSGKITIRDLLATANAGEYLTTISPGNNPYHTPVSGIVPEESLSITTDDLDAIVADVVKAISKREDVKPKEGVQKYGKVTFADPTNKKYPIDTEEHIRAAWNYINKEKNAAKYSGGEVSAIKRRIVSAWKNKIDKEGPPSVQKKDIDFESDSVLIYDGDWSEVKDMGEGKIGGYAIRFSTKSDPDLVLDYFDKSESNIEYPHSDMPVYYLHGRDDKMGKRSIGRTIATKTDDVGIWIESQLNMRDEYEKAILNMAKSGKLGYSTGALPHMVDRDPRGKGVNLIKTWVVGELSLTPMPAEPRLTVVSLKSLSTSGMSALPDAEDE